MAKTSIDIEKLLRWAYRDELPKQAVGGLSRFERFMYLGAVVDESPRETSFPIAMGPPHRDALEIEWRVKGLPEQVRIEWPRGRGELLGELGCWVDDDDPVVSRLHAEPIALVMMHARMGTRPVWDIGEARPQRMLGKNGKPVVYGITPGRRYDVGAHCPLQLDPSAQAIVRARWEYRVWHAALVALAAESWNLSDHRPLSPSAASHPWVCDDERKPRILYPTRPNRHAQTMERNAAC